MTAESNAEDSFMDTEVLIVGAGPTGLMLANQLARRGLRPMIIDRHSGPAQQSRAMAVHARTLEIYSKMGIAETAIERGAIGGAANMWANGKWAAQIPIGDIGTSLSPFPFVLMLGQDENEIILGGKLREHGIAVQWNTELIALHQQASHVDAVLKQPDGSKRAIRAAWVAGCDGSRSPVREMNGIAFPGAAYEHTFFVADTEATGTMKPGELNVYLTKDGFHLFFPMKGHNGWRLIGILPDELRQKDDLKIEDLMPMLRQQVTGFDIQACHWLSTYRIHHRAAENFRKGRCFLLGDAAHVHSPMGAQGMNTGLQDAYNLGWKLALVVKGQADSALLDSYEKERLPVAQQLLDTTDRAFQLAVSDSWLAGTMRSRIVAKVAAVAMKIPAVRTFAFRTISQIGIHYPESSLSQSVGAMPKDAPAHGDRFPWMRIAMRSGGPVEDLFQALDDQSFNLLVFDNALADTGALGSDLVRVHDIPSTLENDPELVRVKVPGRSFYLLRPDGHVGLCGTNFDAAAIRRYLAETVHLANKSTHAAAA
jgi:2-polyprenyl-6-methoxyphenol hydroxylase-like FAD-dependent oxidoreductase